MIATMSLSVSPVAAADHCRLRFEPIPGRVGERATVIASGFTPNGTGGLEDADQKEGPLPTLLTFDGNGEFRLTFTVTPDMVGRRVFDVSDDATACVAGRIWFVEPAAPDTSTEDVSSEPTHSCWPAALVFLLALGVVHARVRSRRAG